MFMQRMRSVLRKAAAEFKGFSKANDGATAIMFSLMTVVVVGSMAFGIDTSTWYSTDRKLQTAADMAAMAVAADTTLQNATSYNGESLMEIAQGVIERAGIDLSNLTVLQVNNPPTSGDYAGDSDAYEVVLSHTVPIFFAGAFVTGDPQAQARAVALAGNSGDVCVLALHPTIDEAVLFSGSASVEAECGIGANSNSATAVRTRGAPDVDVSNVMAVGGIDDSRGAISGSVSPYANPVINPYADLAMPAYGACDSMGENLNGHTTTTLDPGVYCGDIRLGAHTDTTFNPGTYILDDADFIINGGAEAEGDDITFIFTNSSDPDDPGRLHLNGGSDIELSAPSSGTFEDVLFFRDPAGADVIGSSSDRWIINGNSDLDLGGLIYAPDVEVEFTGTAGGVGECFFAIAGAVTFSGSVDLEIDCDSSDMDLAGVVITTLVE